MSVTTENTSADQQGPAGSATFGYGPVSTAVHSYSLGAMDFETGGWLPEVIVGYETWGTLNADGSNAVLILHALTGDTHASSSEEDPSPGWWQDVVGPGKPVDTNRWFVVAPNLVGGCYGSTGPSSPDPEGQAWGSRFPFVTIRDSVHAEARLADHLGIQTWHAVIGGSMGGARALEWAATYPERVRGMGVVACGAHSTAEQIAFAQAQVSAIRLDANFKGGDYYTQQPEEHPREGLGIARRIAHITYRSEPEFTERFGRQAQPGEDPFDAATHRSGRYQVESYLDYKAVNLARIFDANSYLKLTEALMSHDVARNRNSEAEVLGNIQAKAFIVAVSSDRLYFPQQSYELAEQLPGDVPVHLIDSPIGHDGFLTDFPQLSEQLVETLQL